MSENKQVLEMVEYSEDSPTGLIWKFNAGPRGRKGWAAGSISARGYYQVFHKMKAYRNSRFVNGVWVGQIRCNNERHEFTSKDRSLVENWLTSKRQDLHKEFTNHG